MINLIRGFFDWSIAEDEGPGKSSKINIHLFMLNHSNYAFDFIQLIPVLHWFKQIEFK